MFKTLCQPIVIARDVKATSDVDSVAVSVTVGGTSQGLAAGAALADGGATAIANATGIRSGDYGHNNGCAIQQLNYSGGSDNKCNSSNDKPDKLTPDIINNNAIVVDAEANTHTTSVAADVQIAKEGVAIGAALADNSAKADASSIAIDADELDNVIVNNGNIQLKSNAFAQAVSVGVSVQGTTSGLAAGAALANASVTSNASATGVQAGAGDDVVLNTGSIVTGSEVEKQVQSTATAIGVSGSVLVAEEGAALGAALADTDATATTHLNAMDGQQGDDQLINQGSVELYNVGANADAVSVSVNVAISQSGVAGGAAVVNSDSTAELTANGLQGAEGEDVLVNKNSIGLHNMTADADAVSVALAVAGTEAGVALTGALVDAEATATVNASALNGGADEDRLYNEGAINIDTIKADTNATGVGVGFTFAQEGVAVSAALARSSATANANVTGVDGGGADDTLFNGGTISLNNIAAESDAVSVSVGLAGSETGVSIAAGLTDASGHANTNVTAMDGGSGDDYIRSSNAISISNVNTDGHATGVSVALAGTDAGVAGGVTIANTSATADATVKGLSGGSIAIGGDATLADAESTATSTAVGIYDPAEFVPDDNGGCGDNKHASGGAQQQTEIACNHKVDPPPSQLANRGEIAATASAQSEGLAISGNLLGYALGETTNISTADSAGIRFYEGPVQIYNEGAITANSVANAEGLSVAVTLGGAAMGNTSTTANALATGIESGAGNDKIVNVSDQEDILINVDARSYATGKSISVGLVGVQEAETTNTADASATGINSGAGNDEVLNSAIMNVSAGNPLTSNGGASCGAGSEGACAKSFAVSAVLAGYGSVDASSTANASAIGIFGGAGNDIVQSDQAITATALARGRAEGISITLFGANAAAANTTANASATGLAGEFGEDKLINNSELSIHSGAETYAKSLSITIAGDTSASANTTTNASAVGMDGGADNDRIYNLETGHIDVSARTQSETRASSWSFAGTASAATTLGALTNASGIAGGEGADFISNLGEVDVLTLSSLTATGGANAIFGNAETGSQITATTNAIGIDAGGKENLIDNGGRVSVNASANMLADTTSYSFAGGASTSEFITAKANAAAIDAGVGEFTVYNHGEVNATITAVARTQGSASASFAGGTKASGTVAATVDAAGIDGRNGSGQVFNQGDISILANGEAWATHTSEAGVFFSDGGVVAISSAHLGVSGIALGDGDNVVQNSGNIDVQLSTGTDDYNGDGISEGIFARARAEGGDFDIFVGNGDASGKVDASADVVMHGIAMGDGDNVVHNTGRIAVQDTPDGIRVTAFADPNGGAVTVDGDGWGEANTGLTLDARGIMSGDGKLCLANEGEIEVAVAPGVSSSVDADGGSSGDTDVFVVARITSNAFGISVGEGEHWLANSGSIVVSNSASAAVNGNANGNGIDGDGRVGYGIELSQLPGYARVDAVTAGIDLGVGRSAVIQEGTINLQDDTSSNATAIVDSDFTGAANAYARSELDSTTYAIRTRGDETWIKNSGAIAISTTPSANSYANSDADGNGSRAWGTALARTQLDSTVHGILADGAGNYVANTGSISIDAIAEMSAGTRAESNLDGDSNSRATTIANIGATGVEALGMGSMVEQYGNIAINIDASAIATSWSRADGALADTRAVAVSTADVSAIGVGVHVAQGLEALLNDGDIDVSTSLNTATSTNTEAPGLPKGVENNYSLAKAEAYGLWAGAADTNLNISNAGNITVDASSTAQVSTVGSTYMHTEERAISYAIGIYAVDEEDFTVMNTGTITATASAASNWNDLGLAPIAQAVGIRTGVSNDTIINYGTIDTAQTINGVTTLGIAIDAGAGNDQVILGDGSITNGDINLGTGHDTLSMEGTPIINGSIIDDGSSMTLSFNNSGSYDGSLPSYRAVKNGLGTFTLSMLPQMEYLEMNQGTLHLNNDYEFREDGTFQATVYGDGSNGRFVVDGAASLNGQMNVVRGQGAYRDGTTFEILSSNGGFTPGTNFNEIGLPESKPLLSFIVQQTENSVQVTADVERFSTVATTGNAEAVANHLDAILPTVSGDLSNIVGEVQVLDQQQEFADALYSLSPAAYNQFSQVSIASGQQYTHAINSRMSNLHFSEVADAKRLMHEESIVIAANGRVPQGLFAARTGEEYQYGVYIRGFGQQGIQDATTDNPGHDFTINGVILGFDHQFANGYTAGISMGNANNNLTGGNNTGGGDIETTVYSLYGSYLSNNAYFDAVLSTGNNQYSTSRNILIGPTTTKVDSEHDGDLASLALSGGKYYQWGSQWLRAYASLQYANLYEGGFTESGSGASLIVTSRSTEALISQLGLGFLHDYKVNSGYVTTELNIAWNHDFNIDDHVINASYAGAPDVVFSIAEQKAEANGILLGAGFSYETQTGYITTIKLSSEFRDNYNANSIIGEFRYAF